MRKEVKHTQGIHSEELMTMRLLISALINPMQARMKVVLSLKVNVSGVLCHLYSSTEPNGHDDSWWLWRALSSGCIDCYFGLNVGQIYSVLICLLDVK